ncbi:MULTISPECIES: hypothetical protein [unclassified Alteromonas]|uniref:hypothetical protein n=1 Tax=unclassified Alteromonas TaxID=2614992 RepID=UPI001E431867|nr:MULTISPECIES: hypothetical protein [unclassified Alteromonas]MDO6474890.1 hypothetical protein [Alteromonas sp. 1_MG-2023]MEC7691922.1 hypothetical protein [Pseudomonadota bacterium]
MTVTVYAGRANPVRRLSLVAAALGFSAGAMADMSDIDISGSAGVETRYFLQDAAYPGQPRSQASVFLEPEMYTEWNDGIDSILFKPFARLDQEDEQRTHFDLRELMWMHAADNWETRVGVSKVFWGQTESIHLVDIINQTDMVENIDGEDKLGQPMINLNVFGDWGTLSGFVLPYFRERTFPGEDGRLRPPVEIRENSALYESDDEQNHVDFALRWQRSLGDWEIGLSYFDGTTREPELLQATDENSTPFIQPYYAQIEQYGVDLLKVQGAWLLKFEGIYRAGQSEDFAAAVAGFERTSVGVFGTSYDLGVLMEYQYDEREDNFFATGQNDLMLGLRWVWNDIDGTEILSGFIQDLDESDTYSAFVEASSRMTDNWRWKMDAYFFSSDQTDDTFYYMRRDDHVQVALEYYF